MLMVLLLMRSERLLPRADRSQPLLLLLLLL
jgi:hypothetical protein